MITFETVAVVVYILHTKIRCLTNELKNYFGNVSNRALNWPLSSRRWLISSFQGGKLTFSVLDIVIIHSTIYGQMYANLVETKRCIVPKKCNSSGMIWYDRMVALFICFFFPYEILLINALPSVHHSVNSFEYIWVFKVIFTPNSVTWSN